MTHQRSRGHRPGPDRMAEPCGHRRSVTLPDGPLVVAGVSGSPGSVHALRHAADLARRHGATLVPVLAWMPPGGDLAERKHPDPELRQLWQQDAWQRLRGALGTAFGGFPRGVRAWPLVLRGQARTWSASPASPATCWSSAPAAAQRSPGWCAARSPVTAWPTPTARCSPCRPPTWPSTPATACAAGHTATAASTPAKPACPARRPDTHTNQPVCPAQAGATLASPGTRPARSHG